MATDFQDPEEELREQAGAARGATGSEILASGGDVFGAAVAITGTGRQAGIGTVRRLIESGATDAPTDILAKFQGTPDPNPGHTSPEEARSATSQARQAAQQAAGGVLSGLPSLEEVPGGGMGAAVAVAAVGVLALVLGGAAAAMEG